MDLLKRLITLVVISIFSIVITCHANPPETGSFKIPQIVITNKDALKIVFDATKFAKKNGCNPAEYNIYFNFGQVQGSEYAFPKYKVLYSLCVELEATSNIPWYKWDSFAVVDGYTCFFDSDFTHWFAKKLAKKQRVFNYSFVDERENKSTVFEYWYKFYIKEDGSYDVSERRQLWNLTNSREQRRMQKKFEKSRRLISDDYGVD